MKKRIGLIFAALLGFCALGGMCFGINSNNGHHLGVYAEPESSEPAEPAFEEKVYTYEDEEGTSTLTLISETEFTMVMQKNGEEPINGAGTYTKDGNVLTLIVGDKELKVTIDNEKMTFAEYEEVFECKVVLSAYDHGSLQADKLEGHVGDIITLTAKHDIFYLVDFVKVNGVNIVEDEEISGVYKFALVEGDNKITAKFIVDAELLGEMSIIYEQASNKDWTNLFTLENVVRIVSFLLSGGLLIAMVKYFVKDKRIAKNVETNVKASCEKIIPETTKQIVAENIKNVIQPIFAETAGYQQEIIRVLGILVKCIALMQEDTPDAKRAVLAELSNLNIGDMKVIEEAKNFIDKYFSDKMVELQGVLDNLDSVIEKNKQIASKVGEVEQSNGDSGKKDNGIQI